MEGQGNIMVRERKMSDAELKERAGYNRRRGDNSEGFFITPEVRRAREEIYRRVGIFEREIGEPRRREWARAREEENNRIRAMARERYQREQRLREAQRFMDEQRRRQVGAFRPARVAPIPPVIVEPYVEPEPIPLLQARFPRRFFFAPRDDLD